ncbi:MAG: mannose-6-phosphate isomerase, class I [Caldithrix sp.]|nr:mannose-6-phosphate isomerase, class I [Caldithrix sp.]
MTERTFQRPYLLQNTVQHYAWGMRGDRALIPRLLGMQAESGTPYAELWMGGHPKAPSQVQMDKQTLPLNTWIARHPLDILGFQCYNRFGDRLPFLFKVLSAAEALSIQAHPDKVQAQKLHDQHPQHYPDDNHKPEIAIALDRLTALVGFRSLPELWSMIQSYPPFRPYLGQDVINLIYRSQHESFDKQKHCLRMLYTRVMRKAVDDQQALSETLQAMENYISGKNHPSADEDNYFLSLRKKYGDDVGLLSLFLLNRIELQNGQGVFLGPGIPHAYLQGNIVECMANSDNVVRAGLTPKHKDTETLLNILTYEPGFPKIYTPDNQNTHTVYHPPVEEFAVERYQIKADEALNISTYNRVQIWLTLRGQGTLTWPHDSMIINQGQVVLIPASLNHFTWHSQENMEFYMATVPPSQGSFP